MSRWVRADDNKLLQLLQNNTINSALTHQAIETVRITHWPDKEYKTFAQLYRKKIRHWNAENTLQGARRGENLLMLLPCCFFQAAACIHACCFSCSSSSSSAGVAAPAAPVAPVAPPAAPAVQAQPTRRAVRFSELHRPPARDNEEKDEDEEDEENYSVGEDDEDGESACVEEEEEAEEIADTDVDEAAEELAILLLGNSKDGDMQCFPYPWYDESGRQRLTVEFLVIGLAEEDFTAKVSRNGMSLILKYTVPQVFFNPARLLTAHDGKVTESHSKYTAFAKAVHAFKSSITDGYDNPVEKQQQVKLPFKVEQEFFIDEDDDTDAKGYELHAFPHPNKKMRNANQFMFVFRVELVSVVKPKSLKKAKPRKEAFRMVDSCESSSEEDDYTSNRRRPRNQGAPADVSMSNGDVEDVNV